MSINSSKITIVSHNEVSNGFQKDHTWTGIDVTKPYYMVLSYDNTKNPIRWYKSFSYSVINTYGGQNGTIHIWKVVPSSSTISMETYYVTATLFQLN